MTGRPFVQHEVDFLEMLRLRCGLRLTHEQINEVVGELREKWLRRRVNDPRPLRPRYDSFGVRVSPGGPRPAVIVRQLDRVSDLNLEPGVWVVHESHGDKMGGIYTDLHQAVFDCDFSTCEITYWPFGMEFEMAAKIWHDRLENEDDKKRCQICDSPMKPMEDVPEFVQCPDRACGWWTQAQKSDED